MKHFLSLFLLVSAVFSVHAQTKAVNTSGWPNGIYIAIALIDNQYYSLKFSI